MRIVLLFINLELILHIFAIMLSKMNEGKHNVDEDVLSEFGQQRRKLLQLVALGITAAVAFDKFGIPFLLSSAEAAEARDGKERAANGLADTHAVHARENEAVREQDIMRLDVPYPKDWKKMLGGKKRGVIINKTYHRFWLFDGGNEPILTGPVSTSRHDEINPETGEPYKTPEGLFHALRIEGPDYESRAYPGSDMGHAVIFTSGGHGIHRSGNYAEKDGEKLMLLDRSHGCVNAEAEAAALINKIFRKGGARIRIYSEKGDVPKSDPKITREVKRRFSEYENTINSAGDFESLSKDELFLKLLPPKLPLYSNASDEVRSMLFAPQRVQREGLSYRFRTLSLFYREGSHKQYFAGSRVGNSIVTSGSALMRARLHMNSDYAFATVDAFTPEKSLKNKPNIHFEEEAIDRKWGRISWISRDGRKAFAQSAGGRLILLKKGSSLLHYIVTEMRKSVNLPGEELERRLVGKYLMPLAATDVLLNKNRMTEIKGAILETADDNNLSATGMVLETGILRSKSSERPMPFAIVADTKTIKNSLNSDSE